MSVQLEQMSKWTAGGQDQLVQPVSRGRGTVETRPDELSEAESSPAPPLFVLSEKAANSTFYIVRGGHSGFL